MNSDEWGCWYYLGCSMTPSNLWYFLLALWSCFMNVSNQQSWFYLSFVPYLWSFGCWNCRVDYTHQWWCCWSYYMRSSLVVRYLSWWSRPFVWIWCIYNNYDLLGVYCTKVASVIHTTFWISLLAFWRWHCRSVDDKLWRDCLRARMTWLRTFWSILPIFLNWWHVNDDCMSWWWWEILLIGVHSSLPFIYTSSCYWETLVKASIYFTERVVAFSYWREWGVWCSWIWALSVYWSCDGFLCCGSITNQRYQSYSGHWWKAMFWFPLTYSAISGYWNWDMLSLWIRKTYLIPNSGKAVLVLQLICFMALALSVSRWSDLAETYSLLCLS